MRNAQTKIGLVFLTAVLLFWSCDHGELGGADQTVSHSSGSAVFQERMAFFDGVWYSGVPGIGQLDGYRLRRWGGVSEADRARMRSLFPGMNVDSPRTYSSRSVPQSGDYVLLYDDGSWGESWGFSYMGLVRAINIFNGDLNRGAIIIEYFEGADPRWLWSSDNWNEASQGLAPGEKPFFGMYFRVIDQNTVQMANAVNLASLHSGELYYTETSTLAQAIAFNSVENEAELISWGVVTPQNRER